MASVAMRLASDWAISTGDAEAPLTSPRGVGALPAQPASKAPHSDQVTARVEGVEEEERPCMGADYGPALPLRKACAGAKARRDNV